MKNNYTVHTLISFISKHSEKWSSSRQLRNVSFFVVKKQTRISYSLAEHTFVTHLYSSVSHHRLDPTPTEFQINVHGHCTILSPPPWNLPPISVFPISKIKLFAGSKHQLQHSKSTWIWSNRWWVLGACVDSPEKKYRLTLTTLGPNSETLSKMGKLTE